MYRRIMLLAVAGVVGTIQREVAQRRELRLLGLPDERWFGLLTDKLIPPRCPRLRPSPRERQQGLDRDLELQPPPVHLDQDRRRDP
jgi:hypothetical protein